MTLSYTLTRDALRQGAALHYTHRMGKWRYVRIVLGVLLLAAGIYILNAEYSRFPILGAAFSAFGLVTCFRKPIFCRRVVRSFFKTIDEPPEIKLIMNEEGVDIQSKHSNGTDWAGLVDYRSNDHGILLYPQAGIFYWIPACAEVSEGDWSSVVNCVETNVKRKL